MEKRVVITGIGAVTPIGIGKDNYLRGLKEGKCGIQKLERFYPENLASKIAGEVTDFSFRDYIPPKNARKMDRATRFGVVAAKQALQDANLEITPENETRIGVLGGSSLGGIQKLFKFHEKVVSKGPKRALPHYMYSPIDACAGYIALENGIKGINSTTVTGCVSTINALGMGLLLIRSGIVDSLVVFGTEMPLIETIMAPFCNSNVLSTRNDDPQRASRPYDKDSDGFVIAEGAGAVILESIGRAEKRGVEPYAELLGFGTQTDAYSMIRVAPTPKGLENSMKMALAASGVDYEEIDYVNTYSSSLKHYDVLETQAIKNVFGEHAYQLAVSSTKSMIGHLLGASGMVETIATVLAIKEEFLPPTLNLEEPHPECDLDYVPQKARDQKIRVAVKNSIGNGNMNSTIVLKRI